MLKPSAMQLYRNDKDSNLWVTTIGSYGKQLNLTEIAQEIRAKGLPEDEVDAKILSHVDSSVTCEEISIILAETRKELRRLKQ